VIDVHLYNVSFTCMKNSINKLVYKMRWFIRFISQIIRWFDTVLELFIVLLKTYTETQCAS